MSIINLENALINYYKGLPHQKEAIRYLIQQIKVEDKVLEKFAEIYRCGGNKDKKVPLADRVPFFPQTDNYRDADRTCFSSTCAMLLAYLKPGSIKNDDDYLRVVFSIGDTVYSDVQIEALKRFGIKAQMRCDLGLDEVREHLANDIPVPVGFYHRGSPPVFSGGHWAIIIGETKETLIFHDPYGSMLDGYTGSVNKGKKVHYPKSEFLLRWEFGGPKTGWGITLA